MSTVKAIKAVDKKLNERDRKKQKYALFCKYFVERRMEIIIHCG